MSNNDFLFTDEPITVEEPIIAASPWLILVVDDDESIHQITSLVLSNFSFEQRPLLLLHARSAKQAEQLIEQEITKTRVLCVRSDAVVYLNDV